MDGILFDSAGVVPEAYIASVRELEGLEYRPQDIFDRYSLGPPQVILSALLGRACGEADLETYYLELSRRAEQVVSYPEIQECLAALANASIRLAVFTGASLRACIILLDATALSPHFGVIVGGDQIARPKPHPDGILTACNRLGVPPEAAAYVGDAPVDMEAARRAGALALGAGWGHQFSKEAMADFVLSRPSDLLRLLYGGAK